MRRLQKGSMARHALAAALLGAPLLDACDDTLGLDERIASVVNVQIAPAPVPALTALGDTLRLSARPLDRAGRDVQGVPVRWTSSLASVASVDSSGLVRAAANGVTTIAAAVGQVKGEAVLRVAQQPASLRIEPATPDTLRSVGDTVRLRARVADARGNAMAEADAAVAWSSSDSAVAAVAAGLVQARGNGRALIRAQSESAADSVSVAVRTPGAPLALEVIAPERARQGDVVQLRAVLRFDSGREDTLRSGPSWRVTDPAAGAVDASGRFVGYLAGGTARVMATASGVSDTAAIALDARALSGSFRVVGNGPVPNRFTSDLWLHANFAYTGTWGCFGACTDSTQGNRLFAWDVSDPGRPVRTDSVRVDARVVNDVKIGADGGLAILSQEGSSDGRNGITLLDLADPLHPRVITRYTQGLENGVHNLWIEGSHAYIVEDGASASGGLHILDVSNPAAPVEVASFYAGTSFVHDVYVRDGLAFVSHWDAGLIILDVGNGIRGGSPSRPVEVSRIITSRGNVHNVWYWPAAAYAFVGEEDFNASAPGRMHVVDLSDLTRPVEVADFFLPGDPPHNFWLDESAGILFAAWYSNGVRALDVSGRLLGSLDRQAREYSSLRPSGSRGAGRIWAPQLHQGVVYASDMDNGLWALSFHWQGMGQGR